MTQSERQKIWPELLKDCGDNGRIIYHKDWSQTVLGPIESWPVILQTSLLTCLESRFPIGLNWGKELIHLYNDAARPIVEGHDGKSSIGSPISDVYSEIWQIIEPMFKAVLELGHSTWVEDQLVLTNRNNFIEETYMTWSYSPIRDEHGVIRGTTCSVLETTGKVIGERRLRMLQEMASRANGKNSVLEACRECIDILKDNENDIPYAVLRLVDSNLNKARVVGSFGITVPDRAIDDVTDHYHPALVKVMETKKPLFVNDLPSDVKIERDVSAGPKTVYVLPLVDKFSNDSSVIGFLSVGLSSKRPFDDDYKKFLDILSNQVSASIISARSQELALLKSREEAFQHASELSRGEINKLSQLLDASKDHVFILDREGRYIYHNQATANALKANLIDQGRGSEPTLNRNGIEMNFEKDFLKRFTDARLKAFTGKAANVDVLFPTLEGPREFECILSPMYDENGNVVTVAGITRDVSDLKQSIKVRDEFLSIASHELKTPLTTLKLQSQLRTRMLEKGKVDFFSVDKLDKMFHDDDMQINRLNRLVDDMLDASRMNAGKIELHMESFDIQEVVHDVLNRLSLHLQNNRIDVKLNMQPVVGVWDKYRLEQVFTNLLTNAIKYGEQKPITIETKIVNDELVMSIKDEGMGIKKDDQKRIFQQFERAINSSSVSGLGLGLYIVSEIVKTHGGEISLESRIHRGSTFIVKLPLKTKLINS